MDDTENVMKATEFVTFYIKTIQFFDENGRAINSPILVEQVFGGFEDINRLYDVAHMYYKNKIYYFKRIFSETASDMLTGKNDASMNSFSNEMNVNNGENMESSLQLYSYSLDECIE